MQAVSQIALRIGGTKQRQGGFVPLVSAGVLAGGEGNNMDRATLVSENPSFVIKHAPDYVLYMLCDSSVTSFDISSSGALTIAVTIPATLQIAEGRSPYDLLMQVYDQFRSQCMNQQSNGHYAFQKDTPDSEPFRQLLAQWPVEPRRGDYLPMSAQGLTGIVCMPTEKMADFFRDSMYPELAAYKEVEVGSHCEDLVTPGLERLEVPRPHVYRVQLNGRATEKTLSRPTDRFASNLANTDDEEYDNVDFTLEELLQATGQQLFDGRVRLLSGDIIDCRVPARAIEYLVNVYVRNDDLQLPLSQEDIDHLTDLIGGGQLQLLLGRQPLSKYKKTTADGQTLLLVPAAMIKQTVSTSPLSVDGFLFSTVMKPVPGRSRELELLLKARHKPQPVRPAEADLSERDRSRDDRYGRSRDDHSDHGRDNFDLRGSSEDGHRSRRLSGGLPPVRGSREDQNSQRDLLPATDPEAETKPTDTRNRRWLIIPLVVAAVLLLLLGGVLGWLLFASGEQKQTPPVEDVTDLYRASSSTPDDSLRSDTLLTDTAKLVAGASASSAAARTDVAEVPTLTPPAHQGAEEQKQNEEADRKAREEKLKKEQAAKREAKRTEVLSLINALEFNKLSQIWNEETKKAFTKQEKQAIDALFWGYDGTAYESDQKGAVKGAVKRRNGFATIDEIVAFKQTIPGLLGIEGNTGGN